MPYTIPPDVQRLVADQLATGYYVTTDDVLRDALRALRDEAEDLAAVRAAVAEMQAGDSGLPLDEALDAVRCTQRSPLTCRQVEEALRPDPASM